MSPHLEKILTKMCEVVGAKYGSVDFTSELWFWQYSWTQEQENEFIYTIHRCPVCWGRKNSDKPVCFAAPGLLQEGLKWLSGGNEFRVNESKCCAVGDDVCEFVILKEPIS